MGGDGASERGAVVGAERNGQRSVSNLQRARLKRFTDRQQSRLPDRLIP
jgi:hypothetical protein